MLEALDPASGQLAKPFVATLGLSAEAAQRLDAGSNVRGYVERLIADGLPADALAVIARTLPAQYLVAWCCECIRASLGSAVPPPGAERAALEAERTALALAEQCLRQPNDANRQLCTEFAERARHAAPGAWLAAAAAWSEGSLAPPGVPPIPAPREAVADAVLAALKMTAGRASGGARPRLEFFASRALAVFGAG